MERLALSGKPITSTILKNGTTVSIEKRVISRPIPESTANHEAAHVVASRRIIMATIIPSGNALGTTIPEVMTVAGAAAADALGYSGTSWDMFVTEHVLGVPAETARAVAQAELAGQEEVRYEVATVLQEKKTIGQKDVEKARENVTRRRNGIHIVDVTVTPPQGKTRRYQIESFRNVVLIEDIEITQEKAA